MHILFVISDVLEFRAGISSDFCVLQVLNLFFLHFVKHGYVLFTGESTLTTGL